MPAWPGGPCPNCGEVMPENLVHCRTCRTLLNSDLESDSVEIPQFIPLQEIASMVEVELSGYYVGCPHCRRELRVSGKYIDEKVQCKFCDSQFAMDFSNPALKMLAFYSTCPHCKEELRAAPKYMGMKVACKHCGGKIHFVDRDE
jgi:DNA-directed RNA polymerase subunit RPC12/RpoP